MWFGLWELFFGSILRNEIPRKKSLVERTRFELAFFGCRARMFLPLNYRPAPRDLRNIQKNLPEASLFVDTRKAVI